MSSQQAEPQGEHIGTIDEYGTVWAGEPGASERIGDVIARPDGETQDLYLALRLLKEWP